MGQQLSPSEINYSQDSISCNFISPYKKIGVTLDDLCEGRILVSDIPSISVSKVKGQWVTQNNRRLWVFRHLQRLGKCSGIPVRVTDTIPDFQMTSRCGGQDVHVRGDPGGHWYRRSPSSVLCTLSTFVAVAIVGIGAAFLLKRVNTYNGIHRLAIFRI